jgi:predicted permease
MNSKAGANIPLWKEDIRQRLADLRLSPVREAEIVEELVQHLDDRYEELLANGLTAAEASQAARAELSENDLLVRELRRVERRAPEPLVPGSNRRSNMIAGIWQDLRYGARSLTKHPGFSIVVVITLALGIGVNTALFSVVNGVLLNPLPYPQPDQLVTLHQSKPNFETGAIPYPNFRDMQARNRTFSAMAVSRGMGFSLIGSGEAERVTARLITADFFSVLGVQAALGRTFAPGEDESGVAPLVLISADLWQRKFGAAADVLGKSLTLDDKSYTIVGVIPATYNLSGRIDVYVPMGQWNNPALRSRAAALSLHGIGRLKPGVSIEQAQSDLDGIMRELAIAYPETNRGNGAKLVPLKERIVGSIGPTLWMLLGAVGFVLLIACVNVSNLMLARSTGRTREFAIRAALGAGQWRLLRQSLTESVLLACSGGLLGLIIAGWGTKAALSLLPTTLPRAEEVRLDARVLLFTVAISLLTGIVAGLVPALKTSRWRLSETLKEGGRGASTGRVRAQAVFVAVEMALALVLLIGAGLMIRSMSALWNVNPGFRPDNVLTFGLSLDPSMTTASAEAIRANLRQLSEELSAAPGIQAVSFSAGAAPLQGEDDLFFWLDDKPKPASQSEMSMAVVYRVEPGYLTTMGITLKRGRFFNNNDDERSLPVVVIDEVFARQYFGNTDPLGKRVHLGDDRAAQIVGVVGHVKQWSIESDDEQSLQAQIYEPFRQLPDDWMRGAAAGVDVVTRSDGGPTASFDSIRRIVQSQHNQNVISNPQTMNEIIAGSLAQQRFSMILLDGFAVVALLLASIGLYGVISYLVGQRTHEIGIRIALGAQRKSVVRLVLGQGMKMALVGVALGLFAALGLTRLLSKMVYGVSTTDPATFAVISLLLITVALLACFVPALRATRVDPLVALRYE